MSGRTAQPGRRSRRRGAEGARGRPGAWRAELAGLLRARGADVAVLTALVLLALLPLWPVFATGHLVAAVVGGALLGAGLAVVGALLGWGALTVAAGAVVTLAACSALGAPTTALGGAVPTPATLGAVAQAAVTSWKQLVTVLPPLGAHGGVLTAPYLLAFVATLAAVTIALRTSRPAWALLPPALALAAAILLGTSEAQAAVPVGAAGALGALAWGTWRTGRMHPGRLRGAVALLLAGAVAGTGVALAPPASPRFVLRDHVEPPPDPRDFPSPLAGFRGYVKDHRDETVLAVDGLPGGARVRLAVLDAYDGTAWSVSGEATSGRFVRVGERVEPELREGLRRMTVTVGEYADVWVPMVGRPYDVDFTGARAADLQGSLYVNRTTGTGLAVAGLRPGDSYELLAALPPEPSDSALGGAPVADVAQPQALFPEVATAAAARLTAQARTPLTQIRAIESGLRLGYFSHGLEGETPSLPGHGAARVDELLGGEAMIGDDEQYAAAMALMLRAVGIPSRVVMGLEAPPGAGGHVALTGDDVTAWVEVPFEGHGWVSFFPTPDEDRIWQGESPSPQNRPQPQVLQPPPPAQEPPDVPPTDRQDVDTEDQEDQDAAWPRAVLVAAAVTGGLLVLLAPPARRPAAQGQAGGAPPQGRHTRRAHRRRVGGGHGRRRRRRCRAHPRRHPPRERRGAGAGAGGRRGRARRARRRRRVRARGPQRAGRPRLLERGRRHAGRHRGGGRPPALVAGPAVPPLAPAPPAARPRGLTPIGHPVGSCPHA
ncbi:transglutaminase-like domain-containing protein [Georgenia sp. AZ-5]|uniref:transglutaminase-like domain-containing protein n=1 Tax=Georgenia sp. AZ-5 TaxID=3367526 RepID=UPI0037546021